MKVNYNYYLICYDISDDKTRTKLAKFLKRNGCYRIQKSVFLFGGKKKQAIILWNNLLKYKSKISGHDHVMMTAIRNSKNTNFHIGYSFDFDVFLGKEKHIFIE